MQVTRKLFSYWASGISGLSNVTLIFNTSTIPQVQGDAVSPSLEFNTQWLLDEAYWVFIPL